VKLIEERSERMSLAVRRASSEFLLTQTIESE